MQHHLRADLHWLIRFSVHNPLDSIESFGNGVSKRKANATVTVTINEPFIHHELLRVTDTTITLETFPGNIHPTFFRIVKNTAYISNNISLLMNKGETLKLNPFVFLQQLSARWMPIFLVNF